MSKFGWSYPAGCNSVPADEPEDPMYLICTNCGSWLADIGDKPTSIVLADTEWDEEDGEIVMLGDDVAYYTCPSCGREDAGKPVYAE